MAVKIMVVDDSTTMRKIMEMTFAAENAEVLSVDGVESALGKLDAFAPDVVFADLSMTPDGYELAREMKARRPATAVVALSSQHHPYDAAKGGAAGFDDNVVKPFDTQAMIDRVAQVLGRPRTSPGAAAAPQVPKPAAAPAAGAGAPLAAAPRDMKRTMAFGMPLAPVQNPVGPVQSGTTPTTHTATAVSLPPVTAVAPAPQVPRPAAAAPAPAPAVPKPASAPAAPRPIAVTAPGHAVSPVAHVAPAPAPKPAAAAPAPAPAPASAQRPASAAPVAAAAAAVVSTGLESKLAGLGLTKDQIAGVLALSREVVEQVVWEVVPELAETLIKEEIKRLTSS